MFTDLQLSPSTADEEFWYFVGENPPLPQADLTALLPAGLYRIIDGQLYLIVPGVPPGLSGLQADQFRQQRQDRGQS